MWQFYRDVMSSPAVHSIQKYAWYIDYKECQRNVNQLLLAAVRIQDYQIIKIGIIYNSKQINYMIDTVFSSLMFLALIHKCNEKAWLLTVEFVRVVPAVVPSVALVVSRNALAVPTLKLADFATWQWIWSTVIHLTNTKRRNQQLTVDNLTNTENFTEVMK